ncbi:flavin reductase family protein [Curtobacterium oceanosedimentum]|uniref:flavin reductase family protein n=1 Tax=Curtobacterium oceanosedimentum TaxID=465820 RepID=UPI001CE1192F|nr:flavin reductase family protein [Curtobacterium oceanosedimentum]MCA5924915.1 flavin reductase family protein [Curtobacterium oceanosedimentum]
MQHTQIDPAILYFGTPVVLLSTIDAEGVTNTAPMSSVFWLGHTAVLGMGGRSQTARNLLETGECVINLPSAPLVSAVDALALTTGRDPVPVGKERVGYRHVPDKLAAAGLHGRPGDTVRAERIDECPVHLEARVVDAHTLAGQEPGDDATFLFEAAVSRVHVHDDIRAAGTTNRIDPDRWRPLIMAFQRFYGLAGELLPSRLATIDEEWYR